MSGSGDDLSALLSSPAAVVAAGLLGSLWGSFFNVCIARVPLGLSVVRPPSHCFSCQTPVAARDNIPILSYFILRGRCRHCGARFSARYAGVEALTAALAALTYFQFAYAAVDLPPAVRLGRFAVYFAFVGVLIVLSFIDFDTKLLPSAITWPAVPILFLAAFAAHDVPWRERLIGAAAGYLSLRLVADFYFYVLKREGMGLGDGPLFALIGAVLGWKALPLVLFAASFIGTLVAVPAILWSRRKGVSPVSVPVPESASEPASDGPPPLRRVEIPFGPFLALGAALYLFFFERLGAALREGGFAF